MSKPDHQPEHSEPTARLVVEDGVLVATGETVVDDEIMFALIDEDRRIRDDLVS